MVLSMLFDGEYWQKGTFQALVAIRIKIHVGRRNFPTPCGVTAERRISPDIAFSSALTYAGVPEHPGGARHGCENVFFALP